MTQTKANSHADSARQVILDEALELAPFDGWTEATLLKAANQAGYGEGEVQLYLPGGVLDLLQDWSKRCDQAAANQIAEQGVPNRIRDKVTTAVMTRLDQMAGHEDAAARARARLLLPDGLDRSASLTWATADMIWRAIGDTSTDGNFYSKRTILSGVYATTFAVWLEDETEHKDTTRAFLDRRIENVMEFEKAKAQWRKVSANFPDITGLAARMRYGTGRRV